MNYRNLLLHSCLMHCFCLFEFNYLKPFEKYQNPLSFPSLPSFVLAYLVLQLSEPKSRLPPRTPFPHSFEPLPSTQLGPAATCAGPLCPHPQLPTGGPYSSSPSSRLSPSRTPCESRPRASPPCDAFPGVDG
jgi:hypothetical protein